MSTCTPSSKPNRNLTRSSNSVCSKDKTIAKVVKGYADVRSDENLSRINSDLFEIKGIMDKNLVSLLERGTKLNEIGEQASALKLNSERMLKEAEITKRKLMMRKYLMYAVAFGVFVLLFLLWKFLL